MMCLHAISALTQSLNTKVTPFLFFVNSKLRIFSDNLVPLNKVSQISFLECPSLKRGAMKIDAFRFMLTDIKYSEQQTMILD